MESVKINKTLGFFASFNNKTGYGNHACDLAQELEKLMPVKRNEPSDINLSLLDTVTASQVISFPPKPSILYNVWEASEQPVIFIENLQHYSQLWVASEAQRAWSIAQGVPEEFVFVVPEGVDPEIYKPGLTLPPSDVFNFLVVGQYQRRKSTLELIQAFLKAFLDNKDVRLDLSVDTLFPSDPYKSTEERLEANGINDPRIRIIHFEEREDYVRRVQGANVFLSCARSEGFCLPGIEAMACGVVSIFSDYGGTTEFAKDALLVRVPKLEKPEGIFGGWQVPGMWGSPDYDHLTEVMRDAYINYSAHKKKALITSRHIREKFSWAAAAQKAYDIIQTMPTYPVSSEASIIKTNNLPTSAPQAVKDIQKSIRDYARSLGYEIKSMERRKAIFIIDSHTDTQDKLETLIESIKQAQPFGYPILLVTHCNVPAEVIEMVDYYIYDRNDPMGECPTYWRRLPDGKDEYAQSSIPCHSFAGYLNLRNALDFCKGKFDWIYKMTFDAEADLDEWFEKVNASTKLMALVKYEGRDGGLQGNLISSSYDCLDKIFPPLFSWDEFAAFYGDHKFCAEIGNWNNIESKIGFDNVDWIDIDLGNRFDQVDRDAWKDDVFQCHFMGGPFLHISGISNREYDVIYSNPVDGNFYGLKQVCGMYSRPTKSYYRDWTITATLNGELKFTHVMNLKGQNVIISMGSKALGDTLAWIPYISEFQKKHDCNVYCSTWWNNIMNYPNLNFVKPGDSVENVYASYDVGCYDGQLDKNVTDWRLTNLQKVAADILGLDYTPLRASLKYEPYKPSGNGHPPKPYICFSEFSTMQNKLWNREGAWQAVIDYLNDLGYDCISISAEPTQLKNVVSHNGQEIGNTITDISGAQFYIGLNAGPTWIAYSLGAPVIMVTGVSEPFNDPPIFARIQVNDCRPGCFNDPSLPIDRGWSWCPRGKDFICTKNITEAMVIEQINRLIKEKEDASKKYISTQTRSNSQARPTEGL